MSSADIQTRLLRFVAEQEKSLADLENRYLDEKVRLVNQIAAAKRAAAAMSDAKVELLLDALAAAGIRIPTE